MAKKETVPAPAEYKPRTYVDLEGKELKGLEDLNVGDKITVVLKGKLVSIEKRETEGGTRGSVSLEDPKVAIRGGNAFEELAEDE